MKKLFVWLASVSICAAQAVSIGPFATEGWVEERIKESESVTNGLASVSYVDDLVSDLVSEEELGSSVSNIVPGWALVPVPPVTVEVDPAFTNWLATTNVVIDGNVGAFVSNVVPSWALMPVPPVTAEADPIFTAWEGSNLYVRTVHSGPVALKNTLVVGTATVDQNVTTAVAEGSSKAYANNSHAEGRETRTASNAEFSHVEGQGSKTGGQYSHAAGYRALTAEGGGSGGAVVVNPHDYAWAWNGDYTIGDQAWYASHGPGTFNVNPKGGISSFWIGETNLATYLQNAGGGGGGVTKAYVDNHQWDWSTQVTNAPAFVESEVDPAFTNWLATTNAVIYDGNNWTDGTRSIDPDKTAQITNDWIYTANPGSKGLQLGSIVTYSKQGSVLTFYGDYKKETVPIVYCDNKGTAWFPGCGVGGLALGIKASDIATKSWTDGHEWTWASITNKPSVLTSETDPVFCSWTNQSVLVAGARSAAHADNSGYSTVIGSDVATFGNATLAVGSDLVASNDFSVAVGVYSTKALESYSTAVGSYTLAAGRGSVAVGTSATAGGQHSLAIGGDVTASHDYSVSIGYGTQSHGTGTFNVNPDGGADGFYIGNYKLSDLFVATDAIAPSWQQGSYTNGDFVIYNTHLYECTNATSGAWTPTHWKQTSIAEMMGNLRKILDEINGEDL